MKTYIFSLKARLTLLLMALVGGTCQMSAGHTFSISDFSIAAGEQKEVVLSLTSDDEDIYMTEVYVTLPEGLTFVPVSGEDYFKGDSRLNGADGYLNEENGQISITTFSLEKSFSGKSGALGKFKVEASASLAETSTITLSKGSVWHTTGVKEAAEVTSATVTRLTNTLSVYFTDSEVTMTSGEAKTIEVKVANGMELSKFGFEAYIEVSEGLTIQSVSGATYTTKTGRIRNSADIAADEGMTVSIEIVADADFTGDATITLTDISATDDDDNEFACDDVVLSVTVKEALEEVLEATLTFSESEISLAPGESVDVNVELVNRFTPTGFEAELSLPEGVTATVTASERINGLELDGGHLQFFSTTTTITEREGTLFTLTLTASDSFVADGVVKLTGIAFTNAAAVDIPLEDITLNVKVPKELVLDETSSEAIVAGTYTKVTLKRTFVAGWNTVCLPFAIESVEDFFGEGTKAYAFTSYADNAMNFDAVSGTLTSATPYVVYVPEAISEKELADVTIDKTEAAEVENGGAKFIGSFAPIAAGNLTGKYVVTDEARIAKCGAGAFINPNRSLGFFRVVWQREILQFVP